MQDFSLGLLFVSVAKIESGVWLARLPVLLKSTSQSTGSIPSKLSCYLMHLETSERFPPTSSEVVIISLQLSLFPGIEIRFIVLDSALIFAG